MANQMIESTRGLPFWVKPNTCRIPLRKPIGAGIHCCRHRSWGKIFTRRSGTASIREGSRVILHARIKSPLIILSLERGVSRQAAEAERLKRGSGGPSAGRGGGELVSRRVDALLNGEAKQGIQTRKNTQRMPDRWVRRLPFPLNSELQKC